MLRDAEVKAVGEERVELHAQQAPLGHERAVLFLYGEEVAVGVVVGQWRAR